MMETRKKCAVCGRGFRPRAPNAKFCSHDCYKRAMNARYVARKREKRRAALEIRTCPTCGQEFRQGDPRQVYCSRACLGRAKRRAAQGRPEADSANPRARRVKATMQGGGALPTGLRENRPVADAETRVRAWMELPPAERFARRAELTQEELRLAQRIYLAEPRRTVVVNW